MVCCNLTAMGLSLSSTINAIPMKPHPDYNTTDLSCVRDKCACESEISWAAGNLPDSYQQHRNQDFRSNLATSTFDNNERWCN